MHMALSRLSVGIASAGALIALSAGAKPRLPVWSVRAVPDLVTAKPGSTVSVRLEIARESSLVAPLTVKTTGLPPGGRAKPLPVPADQSAAELPITLAPGTLPGGPYPVEVRTSGGGARSSASLGLRVVPADASGTWLDRVNLHRSMARLPPVVEEPEWSRGCFLHTRYMVENRAGEHDEKRGNPFFTEAGLACAKSANLGLDLDVNARDETGIDGLVAGPFHGVQLIDPGLSRTGFASYRKRTAGPQMASAIDVLRGRGDVPASIRFPVLYPADGATAVLSRLSEGEWPSSLPSCPGFASPLGAPIYFLAGGAKAPSVTLSRLTVDGREMRHCRFDENTYAHPIASDQHTGRSILATQHTVVILPGAPLARGQKASVSLTVDGQTTNWSFTMGGP